MNIFVASWFFPPATSSEGIVTYKLLRNSKNTYDVFSSTSKQWGYSASMRRNNEKNIVTYAIDTDDINEWVDASVAKFEELYPQQKYECIMTRSTPPESILIGSKIKKKYPNVKWIASLADPVSNNPYELKAYIDDCKTLNNLQKEQLRAALLDANDAALTPWEKRPEEGIQLLCKLKRWENLTIREADLIISPTSVQLRYMLQQRSWKTKYFALPHSFDKTFYKEEKDIQEKRKPGKIVFSFIGYSDAVRSLEPFVRAVRYLCEKNSPFLERLDMRFIGNNPSNIRDLVLNYFLDGVIHFQDSVDYYESLELMQESDWLLHVDAFFHTVHTGGSIFFAGKLADYMGAHRPIFALTGKGSPADDIVNRAGGISVQPWDIVGIANKFEDILSGRTVPVNDEYITQYSAERVAENFDLKVNEICGLSFRMRDIEWNLPIQVKNPSGEKLITVCVPAYNVEKYLERCLKTLVYHIYAQYIEVLIIDDGSIDHTAYIGKIVEKLCPGVVRIISKENGGHGSTINRAIQEASGRYFMVVDGDDWVDSQEFAKLIAEICSGHIVADIVSSNYHEINMETGELTPRSQQIDVRYGETINFEDLDVENIYFTLASSLIKTDILRSMNKPLQEHTFYVDVEYILFPVPYLNTVEFVNRWIYKYYRGNEEQSVYLPTMVNRYEHHERVMKSVLEYENSSPMSLAQHTYYNAILKRLLYTHYALCLVYDDDKQRGFARGREFDGYLIENYPNLAQWIGHEMKLVGVARRHHFDPEKTEKSLALHIQECIQRMKQRIIHSSLLHRLIYNGVTLRVSKWRVFNTPSVIGIKERIKKMI